MAFQPALIPYIFLICTVKTRALIGYCSWAILNKAWSWRGVVFRGAQTEIPGTKFPVAACLRMMRLTATRVRTTRPTIALCHMSSWASASISYLIHIGVGQGIIRKISENWEKHVIVYSNWALKWKSGQGQVAFRWGAVTGTFYLNFSPLEAHQFHPYWLYFLKWECNKPIFPGVYITKGQLWYFLYGKLEQAIEQTVELPVIWDAKALMLHHVIVLSNLFFR